MLTLKNTLKVAVSCLLFGSSLAAAALGVAIVGLALIGLVDWTGAQQVAGLQARQGAVEDHRAEILPPAEVAPTD